MVFVALRAGVVSLLWLLCGYAAAADGSMAATATQTLSFGRFAAGTGGSISITPAGARSAGGTVALIASSGSAAQFSLTGTADLLYSITLPPNGTVSLKSASGHLMPLTQFTSVPSGTGQLSALGRQTVSVGATLNVGAMAAPGSYTGSFDLILNYN